MNSLPLKKKKSPKLKMRKYIILLKNSDFIMLKDKNNNNT